MSTRQVLIKYEPRTAFPDINKLRGEILLKSGSFWKGLFPLSFVVVEGVLRISPI